jgi:chromate reductase, NAD(P)H dehydrogenase (quinone)
MTTILALSGSSRRDSLNQKLLDRAVLGAREAGAEVTPIRLSDFALPIYDADWEAEHGLPEGAQKLKALLASHRGLLIATPEHNGGYTALLKNALDWMSRPNGFPSGGRSVDLSLSRAARRREIPALLANRAHQAWRARDS